MKIVVNENLAVMHEQTRIDSVVTVEITDAIGHLYRLFLCSLPFLKERFGVMTAVTKGSGGPRMGPTFRLTLEDLTTLSSALTEVLHSFTVTETGETSGRG